MALIRTELPSLSEASTELERKDRDAKAQALMRVLAAYDVLEDRSYDEQQALVEAILKVFFLT